MEADPAYLASRMSYGTEVTEEPKDMHVKLKPFFDIGRDDSLPIKIPEQKETEQRLPQEMWDKLIGDIDAAGDPRDKGKEKEKDMETEKENEREKEKERGEKEKEKEKGGDQEEEEEEGEAGAGVAAVPPPLVVDDDRTTTTTTTTSTTTTEATTPTTTTEEPERPPVLPHEELFRNQTVFAAEWNEELDLLPHSYSQVYYS